MSEDKLKPPGMKMSPFAGKGPWILDNSEVVDGGRQGSAGGGIDKRRGVNQVELAQVALQGRKTQGMPGHPQDISTLGKTYLVNLLYPGKKRFSPLTMMCQDQGALIKPFRQFGHDAAQIGADAAGLLVVKLIREYAYTHSFILAP
jgi:hypothetical protein